MNRISRFAIPVAMLFAFSAPGLAAAQECKTDADCGSGEQCVKGMGVPGCEDPSAGCPSEPVESELGYCEVKPISCSTDADCPSFMRCMDEEVVCWSEPEGGSGCDTPDPSKRTCRQTTLSCATNADCPAHFDCVEAPVLCAEPECAPGTDCEPTLCEGTEKMCVPQQIACTTSSDCPSAWSCEDMGTDCAAASGAEGVDCGGSSPALACVPTGYGFASGAEAAKSGAGQDAASESNGGCSVSAPARGSEALSALLAMLGLSLLRRRRAAR